MAKSGQALEGSRRASVETPHRRSRERLRASYLIACGRFNATTCSAHIGRQDEAALGWVRRYNEHGPDALAYRRTGGHAPPMMRARPDGWPTSSRPAAPSNTAYPATAGR